MKLSAGQADHIKYDFYLDGVLVEQFVWTADEEEGYVEVYEREGDGPRLKTIPEFAKRSISKLTGSDKKTTIVKMIVPWDWTGGQAEIIPAPWPLEAVKTKKYGKVELKLREEYK